MLKKIKLTVKLPFLIVALALLTAVITGATSYYRAYSVLEDATQMKSDAVADGKRNMLLNYLNGVKEDLITLSQGEMVEDAIRALGKSYAEMGPEATRLLQKTYIDENPNPVGHKNDL